MKPLRCGILTLLVLSMGYVFLHYSKPEDSEPTANGFLALGRTFRSWSQWQAHENTLKNASAAINDNDKSDPAEKFRNDMSRTTQDFSLVKSKPSPRVAKCTIVFGATNPVYERALLTHTAHNERHGYLMYVLRQTILDDVWTKPAFILSLLLDELAKPEDQRLEWLFWVDADTILLNPYIPIEIFLPPEEWEDVNLLISHDYNGVNNGVFPIRVQPWSAELLSAVVAFRHYRPEDDLTFRDQSAMSQLLDEPRFRAHTVVVPQRWFNAYQGENNETLAPFQVRRGDFLVHFAGVPNRDERMGYWLDRTENNAPEWAMETDHTSFPGEIRDFWDGMANEKEAERAALDKANEEAQSLVNEVDNNLRLYSKQISEDEVAKISTGKSYLLDLLAKDKTRSGLESLEDAIAEVKTAIKPLDAAASEADKALLRKVHDLVFRAEGTLLSQSRSSSLGSEYSQVKEKARGLKTLVLQPHWIKTDVEAMLRDLEKAHSALISAIPQNNAGPSHRTVGITEGTSVATGRL